MELKFPSFSEYQSALQNPGLCFKHYPLTDGKIEQDLWGLPRVRSGGFALTYKLSNHKRKLAVRCFYRVIPDRMQRYYAISKFIETSGSRALIPVRYLSRGIHLQGKSYPITFMDWIDGSTLDEWLVKNHARKIKMKRLVQEFLRLVEELESLQIAHGDLSHRNIIYDGKKAVLIDYDGMFVPSLDGKKACELGNPYFQHPARNDDFFNEKIDRFSEIVIYLALTAIQLKPELYRKYETGGEGLLFTKKDFHNPYRSQLMRDIEAIPELRVMVQNFREICLGKLTEIPSLAAFLQLESIHIERSEVFPWPEESDLPHPVLAAGERKAILNREGEIIQVVGKVTEVFEGKNISGKAHFFINFGNWKKNCFTIVLWDKPLKDFLDQGHRPGDLKNAHIRVNGLVTVYNQRPQISLTSLSEMVVLQDPGKSEKISESEEKRISSMVGKRSAAGRKDGLGYVQAELPAPSRDGDTGLGDMLDRPVEVVKKIDLLYRDKNRKIRDKAVD